MCMVAMTFFCVGAQHEIDKKMMFIDVITATLRLYDVGQARIVCSFPGTNQKEQVRFFGNFSTDHRLLLRIVGYRWAGGVLAETIDIRAYCKHEGPARQAWSKILSLFKAYGYLVHQDALIVLKKEDVCRNRMACFDARKENNEESIYDGGDFDNGCKYSSSES